MSDLLDVAKEIEVKGRLANGLLTRVEGSMPLWVVFLLIIGGLTFNGWQISQIKGWIQLHEQAVVLKDAAIEARVASITTRQTEASRVSADFVRETSQAIERLARADLVTEMLLRQGEQKQERKP